MDKRPRRGFLKAAVALMVSMKTEGFQTAMGRGSPVGQSSRATGIGRPITARDFLAGILNTREGTEKFLSGQGSVSYDPELGWVLRSYQAANDGIDGSTSTCTIAQAGERITVNQASKPCRMNTYGDSFTQCSQVNDGETWQEYLAAHLCEPVRNFGVGGYSVYQAFLRMRREEQRRPARLIIFNVYDDDHYRNLEPWWSIRWGRHPNGAGMTLPYLKFDERNGSFAETANACPTPESLYNLCDLDWVEKEFRDDFVLKIMLEHANARESNPAMKYRKLMMQDRTLGIVTGVNRGKTISREAEERHTRTALLASMKVIEQVQALADNTGKKVLYVLSFNSASIAHRVETGTRTDQSFVDFLNRKGLPYVDLMEAHLADFARYRGTIAEYLNHYYIHFYTGHYGPRGNFFTALAIKDKVRDLLNPRPPAYPA